MHRHGFDGPRGSVHTEIHRSRRLEGNPWDDPVERRLDVYLPPDYDSRRETPYPLLVDLTGYTGAGPVHSAYKTMGENVPERIDRLIAAGEMGPAVVVFPDCFTRLGGNQYVNSPAVGPYADYLIDEIVPHVEAGFRAGGARELRGVFGKSSGGYGAMFHAMTRGDFWGAAASHSGDSGFDLVFRSDFPNLLNHLNEHEGDPKAFIDWYWSQNKPSYKAGTALMLLCMAASYDPDPDDPTAIRLPFSDVRSGVVDEAAWRRWLEFDPVRMVERAECAQSLRSLRLLFVDCGFRDQYHIHYGSRQFAAACERLDIPLVYEEFDDDHSSIDYRMDVSLPRLVNALAG